MDTTNVSALDCYGEDRGITPLLDRLAAECLVYEDARTVEPMTLPAHASMLTGLYPIRHTIRDNGLDALPPSAVTLAERAKEAGLDTAAFLSAAVLAAPFGLDQGFDVYDSPGRAIGGAEQHIAERASSETARLAGEWLRARDRARPFFLWVHFFDPHYPYEPPPAFAARAPDAPYLGEVAAMDASIGALLDALREVGALDEALLVVLADHGEGLGRNGEESHSLYCYDTTLRVPLLIRYPDGTRAGKRSRAPASSIDVFPTVVEALGLGPPGDIDGTSLYRHEPALDRGLYFESYVGFLGFGWSPLAGWVQGDTKYVHGSKPRLFDLARDPDEAQNVIDEMPAAAEQARSEIRAVAARPALARVIGPGIDEALREQVRELGYAGMADASAELPHPLAPCSLPDPHDHKESFVRMNRAVALAGAGRRPEAIALLQELRVSDPTSPFVFLHLGGMLYQENRNEEAVSAFQELLALEPKLAVKQEAWIHGYLSAMLERAGKLEEALAHCRLATALEETPERRERLERLQRAVDASQPPGEDARGGK
jgi:arylsulfatase A-like enzyme